MYLIHTPRFIQNLFPSFLWRIPTSEKKIFLTFDDGPIPDVTPWVLDQLDQFNAKGTFFCVGDNVRKHQDIFDQVVQRGHVVGNHTFNHISGWATDNIPYFHNVRHCARMVESELFRPPYGKLKPKQVQFLSRHYHIVMWDVLSGDFDQTISPQQCFENVRDHSTGGSIIVFHDSLKANENIRYALPKTLEHFSKLGYQFECLNPEYIADSQRNPMIRKTA